jgi:hypothetical protein
MNRLIVISLSVAPFLFAACASTPKAPNKYGHQFEYKYQPPPEVSEADTDECGKRADTAAFASISNISDRGAVLFGAIGAMVQIGRAKHRLNETFEKVMKECLREKGYGLEDAK